MTDQKKPELGPRLVTDGCYALGDWHVVGEGYAKKHPGFASEKSARIAISKNPDLKKMDAKVLPFRYNDGSYATAFSETRTRYIIVVRKTK